jgi:hypothetical protein
LKACKGCGSTTRPLKYEGPRCATCWRIERKRRSKAQHQRRVADVYGLGVGEYDALYLAQGGRCWICRRATGKAKRLAVDHDHACTEGHAPTSACRRCIRGLLCGPCNLYVIGRLDLDALQRAYWYLREPPASRLLPPPA